MGGSSSVLNKSSSAKYRHPEPDAQEEADLGYFANDKVKEESQVEKIKREINGGDDDEDSLSSESADEQNVEQTQGEEEDEKEEKEIEEEELEHDQPVKKAGTGCDPQRRLHYLDIPVGTTGTLTRRVFEVRLRDVMPCSEEDQVIPGKPYASYATTNMLIIRWEMPSFAEAKRVTHYELQWCQPSLGKDKQFKAMGYDLKVKEGEQDTAEGIDETTNEDDTEPSEPVEMEVFCDNDFCTMSNKIIRQLDLRAEVNLHGLPGGCNPLLFRVRTKLGHLGWGPWSEHSEPIATVSNTCVALNVTSSTQLAHAIGLKWDTPPAENYGKVSKYKLLGYMVDKYSVLGGKSLEKYCSGLVQRLSEKRGTMNDFGWVELYEGDGEEFGVGMQPDSGQDQSIFMEAARKLMTARLETIPETDSNAASRSFLFGLESGLLPSSWPFIFKIEAETGNWFHGVYHLNNLESQITTLWTSPPVTDPLPPPFVNPFHGMVMARSLTIHFNPPLTYGGGFNCETYHQMFPFQDSTTWFGLDVDRTMTNNPKKKKNKQPKVAVLRWKTQTNNHTNEARVSRSNISSEGWSEETDVATKSTVWVNSLTGKESLEHPELSYIPVQAYILRGRIQTAHNTQKYEIYYKGPQRHVFIDNLKPNCVYEFILSVICKRTPDGESAYSQPLTISTAQPASEKLTLSQGWVEVWDPTTEFVYYHNKELDKIQWQHPQGSYLDDPDLVFRKKRFKLLHNLYQRIPPAQNVETFKLHLTRDNMLVESFQQLGLAELSQMGRRLNISFEGEEGIDSGGITTEWYLQLSKCLFDPAMGLMQKHSACQLYSIVSHPPKEAPFDQSERLGLFHFMGRLMGKAIYDKRVLSMNFCSFLWRHILNRPPTMEDLMQVDPVFHQSLLWILDNDITDILFETFSIIDDGGKEVDLKPGGMHIDVTEHNKEEYVQRVVHFRLGLSIATAIESLKAGFYEMIPPTELEAFHVHDVELLINGSADIDVKELRRLARYANGYTAKSKQVEYFWNVFTQATPEFKGGILSFITGSTKMPLDEISIQIVKSDAGSESLPTSHTCFNQFVLPEFESQLQLFEKLSIAIENSGGFYMS